MCREKFFAGQKGVAYMLRVTGATREKKLLRQPNLSLRQLIAKEKPCLREIFVWAAKKIDKQKKFTKLKFFSRHSFFFFMAGPLPHDTNCAARPLRLRTLTR